MKIEMKDPETMVNPFHIIEKLKKQECLVEEYGTTYKRYTVFDYKNHLRLEVLVKKDCVFLHCFEGITSISSVLLTKDHEQYQDGLAVLDWVLKHRSLRFKSRMCG